MRSEEEILLALTTVFRTVLDDSELTINLESSPANVTNWDSLSNALLLSAIQKHFGIRFGLKDILNIQNVGDLFKLIQKAE